MSCIATPLKLFHNVVHLETATLQFNWRHPGCIVLLPDEQVIAAFLIFLNRQGCTIQIYDKTLWRSVIQRNRTFSLLAFVGVAVVVNFLGNRGNQSTHWLLPSCPRL